MKVFKKIHKNDLSILISFFFLFVSLVIFFYVVWRSEIIFDGKYRENYIKFYLISIILISFSVISFSIRQNIKINLLILAMSTYLSLLFLEVLLLKLDPKKIDTRSKFSYYESLTDKKTNTRIFIPPKHFFDIKYNFTNYDFIPLSLNRKKKIIVCNENNFWLVQETDKHGFINLDSDWDQRNDLVLIGDSYTQGHCVKKNQNLKFLFEKKNFKVLNLGMGGAGPLTSYAILKEYVIENYNQIIWFFYEGNDFSDLKKENEFSSLKKYLLDKTYTQNLIVKSKEIDKFLESYHEDTINIISEEKNLWKPNILKLNKIRGKISNLVFRLFGEKYIKQDYNELEFNELFREFYTYVKKTGGELIFVYLPEYNRYIDEKNNYSRDKLRFKVKNLVIKNYPDILYIDVHKEIFSKNKNKLKFFPKGGGHYSYEGYKKIVDYVSKKIND